MSEKNEFEGITIPEGSGDYRAAMSGPGIYCGGPEACPHADSPEGCRCDCVQCVGQCGRTGWHSEGGLARSVAIHEQGKSPARPYLTTTTKRYRKRLPVTDPSGG